MKNIFWWDNVSEQRDCKKEREIIALYNEVKIKLCGKDVSDKVRRCLLTDFFQGVERILKEE